MNNADLIVATLKAAGIARGFGIPSGNVLPLMEAMRKGGVDSCRPRMRARRALRPTSAGGHVTGRPTPVATLGSGVTNLTTGVQATSWLDRLAAHCHQPAIVPPNQLGRRIQMWIDHHALFAPITKASFRLEKGKIAETVNEAIRIAMSEPRGPVHLDLPEDVALAPAREDAAAMRPLSKLAYAPDAAVARAGDLIAKAKRPIAVLGSSAMRMAKPELLQQVIERHNLPFATTTMAKGMIDEDHPLSIGVIERSCRQIQRKLLRSADLIVGLGYDTVEVEYEAWIADVPLLQIDIEKADVAPSVKVVHEVTGDLDVSLKKLAALPAATNAWAAAVLADHRRAFHAALRPATNTFTAHGAIDAVRRALPREGLLSFDVGAHTHQIASQWTRACAKDLSHHQWLVVDGFWPAGSDRGKTRAARPAGGLPHRRRLLPDDLRRGGAVGQGLGLTAFPVVVLDDKWLALIKVKQIRRQFLGPTAPKSVTEIIAIRRLIISACRPSASAAPRRWKPR